MTDTSFKFPLVGFVLSILLTVTAYWIVTRHLASGPALTGWVMGLATLQALVQIVCYFHVGLEGKPHWNLIMFLFTVLVIVVVIGGSLWIMHNLNYNVMEGM